MPGSVLPRRIPHPSKVPTGIRVSALVLAAARGTVDEALAKLETTSRGLTGEEAARRLREHGPNVVAQEQSYRELRLLVRALVNPLVILLLVLSSSSFLTGDTAAGYIMLFMIVLGVGVRVVQEIRAGSAAARLRAMISVHATVLRDGALREEPIANLVPGDVVELSAGDMIPADVRLTGAKDLFLTQASLTGESFPVEKFAPPDLTPDRPPLELSNVCFLGTTVESGAATAVVVATGLSTYMGGMSQAILDPQEPSSFDQGMTRFTWMMMGFILVMAPLVFVINGYSKGDWKGAFFFAMAVAVGLTPELLPVIVAVCLSKGALAMSRKKVIIKRLNSIQNIGAMDILCTDKTGTLTMDQIVLERHCDVALKENRDVLALAFLNSHFQTGLKNLMDRAILQHSELHDHLSLPEYSKVDEIPFDFSRKVMSVVVRTPEGVPRLICKGAPEEVYRRCSTFVLDGQVIPMDHAAPVKLKADCDALGTQGFRVLAVATRDVESRPSYGKDDERDLTLHGYVAFLDPAKDSAAAAIAALHANGVAVKVLSGDNELVCRKICGDVGIATEHVLLGSAIKDMSDAELARVASLTTVFARVSPADKQRIIHVLRAAGHVVGFLGDGVNDAPAIRAADVGISVDTAVDIAKETADAILLEKDLMVLNEGVLEGRKVYVNILKFVRMGASSNFGNMFSVLGASVLLPFMPMAPIQILTNNLLYDFSQIAIPTDEVDPEQIDRPRPWSMQSIFRFILFIGPCSSLFDYATFAILIHVFGCWAPSTAPLFQTGWFVESVISQTLIIHLIRTNRVPFIQSRASWSLTVTTLFIMALGAWLPWSPLGPALGFVHLPSRYWPLLALTVLGYALVTLAVKSFIYRRGWVSD